ncbi:MAG: 16S rRNA (cytosine(1402)-N(4))-methyltransferase RsmH [Zetaproteobacteria bacterium CG12_big_fil_rev_8_21_14_0_65_55_1124]|nr:MAG: 16S rRNA (cytosine(1402)-N(4))-methyltransferase [Zetaproteobacteria bacterium CG1_02_55_237]PIS18699.1 MAG: 16S rRNA (cytosine(1402)-N(4))-methyltransferase RsmH [Zetaproteobacteria bacterium CG08_land_8_20_14_0_20_55_17]PIW43674.1 MAG: 16S rRNA (cytosine(1402)-N(4))-methyltransferase RsmH [Zetaproteobacteria bacterium CG12_big_fil_rev_8_21_14_0_65_55_1124]PIY52657.1 MAG: 16S rRNA (cytosine(1402)-N(4))-methyltransferase RsmH [Zetaproteobacteria bacterium CG_4_10_14_0_8_um_filter_55_43]
MARRSSDVGRHAPVLLTPFIDALCPAPDGCYVDATFGRGGHARALLERLSPAGRLIGLDRDAEAVREGERLAAQDGRFCIRHAAFADLDAALDEAGWGQVHGIGFDLGVSSPQLDDAGRGFSFSHDGPLDMRMDANSGQPLSERLARLSERDLADILRRYGNERYAGRIARSILNAYAEGKMTRTSELENVVFHAMPRQSRFGGAHPATRTFQALRMWINDEMGQLEAGITAAMQRLLPGGRLAVISFHSGEDRKVRDLIEEQVRPCTCPPDFPICVCGRVASMRWVQKKPIRASEAEMVENPRSRSALLRVAEKLS